MFLMSSLSDVLIFCSEDSFLLDYESEGVGECGMMQS